MYCYSFLHWRLGIIASSLLLLVCGCASRHPHSKELDDSPKEELHSESQKTVEVLDEYHKLLSKDKSKENNRQKGRVIDELGSVVADKEGAITDLASIYLLPPKVLAEMTTDYCKSLVARPEQEFSATKLDKASLTEDAVAVSKYLVANSVDFSEQSIESRKASLQLAAFSAPIAHGDRGAVFRLLAEYLITQKPLKENALTEWIEASFSTSDENWLAANAELRARRSICTQTGEDIFEKSSKAPIIRAGIEALLVSMVSIVMALRKYKATWDDYNEDEDDSSEDDSEESEEEFGYKEKYLSLEERKKELIKSYEKKKEFTEAPFVDEAGNLIDPKNSNHEDLGIDEDRYEIYEKFYKRKKNI